MRLLILIVLMFLSFPGTTDAAQGRKCHLKQIVGTAKIRRGTSPVWSDARPKMPLGEHDALRTLLESEVELETSEGTVITISENTTIEMSTFYGDSAENATSVRILNGSVLANVKKLVSSGSRFDFETPTATAAIRGTTVGVAVTSDETLVKVYEGKVMVVPVGTTKGVEINSNQMAVVKKGSNEVGVGKIEVKKDTITNVTTSDVPDSLKLNQGGAVSDSSDNALEPLLDKKPSNEFHFSVQSPFDGQEFKKPLISVTGKTVHGAEVSAMSMRLPVTANGQFSGQIPIANESGEYTIEFEATFDGMTRTIIRQIKYKPDYRFNLASPSDRQVVTSTMVQVRGDVVPLNAEISVSGRRLPVNGYGQFNGIVTIPAEVGEVALEFEIAAPGINKTETRIITYKRPPDIIRPSINATISRGCWNVTVFDRTFDEEIKLWYETDGSKEFKIMQPNMTTCIPLQEGIHSYRVYAEDKNRNISPTEILKNYSYLGSSTWIISVRKPSGSSAVVDLPPASPEGETAVYTLEFSIENLPEDNMRLIREVTITNKATGKRISLRTFTDTFITTDIEIKRHHRNDIKIDVNDINNITKSHLCLIQAR